MKKKIVNNWELKLLAILFSVVIWLVVVNIDDPVKSVQFSGVEVEILNQDALTDKGQVYEVVDGTNKVTVTIKGRRTIIEDISKENIRATADMLDKTDMDTLSIKVSTNKYTNDIDGIKCDTENIKLNVEELKKVQKVIEITTEGIPADDYILGDLTTNLNQVYLEGPESSIKKVSNVKATLDVDGISSNISSSVPLVLYDEKGNIIDDIRIAKNINTVSVSQTVLVVKEVPLRFDVIGTPAEGYAMTRTIRPEVSTVKIAGSKGVVDATRAIVVSGDVLDVSDLTKDLNVSVSLEDYLPSNLIFADPDFDDTINVRVEIRRETFLSAVVEEKDFTVVNIPTGMKAEYSVNQSYITDDEIQLKFTGLSDCLEEVDLNGLKGYLDLEKYMKDHDLSKLSVGTYQLTPDFHLPDGVKLQTDIEITVHITENN